MNRKSLLAHLTAAMAVLIPALAQSLEVKVLDPLFPIRETKDFREARDQQTLRLVGPRNGWCSGQVAADTVAPVEIGELRGPGGAVLPREALQVRYARREPKFEVRGPNNAKGDIRPYYDALWPQPDPQSELMVAWITARIPRDVAPGKYEGALRVGDRPIPVALEAAPWVCPDPSTWVTHVGLIPSAEIIAQRYRAPLWSEAHWKLIERQTELMAALGNDELWIETLWNTGGGKGVTHISFTRKNGQLQPVFTVAERYLDVFNRRAWEPKFVIVHLWDGESSKGQGKQRRETPFGNVRVNVDGQAAEAPMPAAEGGVELWQSVLDGVRERVQKIGWRQTRILIGLAADKRPSEETAGALKKAAPWANWVIWTHGRGENSPKIMDEDDTDLVLGSGARVAYYVHPYAPGIGGWIKNKRIEMNDGIHRGWTLPFTLGSSSRNYLPQYVAPSQYRGYAAGNTLSGYGHEGCGFSFLWFDFWRSEDGRNPTLLNRWGSVLTRNGTISIVEPGPDGPVATVRYEMLREGLQENEARIVLEKALLEGQLDPAVEAQARAWFQRHFDTFFQGGKYEGGHASANLAEPIRMYGYAPYPQWQQDAADLFALADRAQAAPAARPANRK